MADADDAAPCSFCGKRESGEGLIEGGGEAAGGLPQVRICLRCAEACVDALLTEERITEARESTPPEALKAKEKTGLGLVLDWTEFMLDGRKLERRHEAILTCTEQPVSLLSLRQRGQTAATTVEVELEAPIDLEYVRAAAKLLLRIETKIHGTERDRGSADTASSSMTWVPFELDDMALEFAVRKRVRVRMSRCVRVTVRDPETGWTKQTIHAYNPVPTVDDAVMAATFGSSG